MRLKRQKKDGLFMLVLEAALLIEEGYGEICDERGIFMQVKKSEEKDLSHHAAIQMKR